jgi:hypothetical protein
MHGQWRNLLLGASSQRSRSLPTALWCSGSEIDHMFYSGDGQAVGHEALYGLMFF